MSEQSNLKITENGSIVDQAVRDQIVAELNTNFVVRAGAGAGKTTLLVARMIAQIESGNIKIGELVSITFTKKAAGEMRERFVEALNERIENSEGEVHDRLQEAQQNIDQCFMGTIHSFCTRILREFALTVGLPADFTSLEEVEKEKITVIFWRKWLAGAYKQQNQALLNIMDAQIQPTKLLEAFIKRNNYRDLVMPVDKVEQPAFRSVSLDGSSHGSSDFTIKEILLIAKAQKTSSSTTCGITKFALKWLPIIEQRPEMKWSDRMQLTTLFIKECWDQKKQKGKLIAKYWADKKIAKIYRDEIIPELCHELLPTVRQYQAWLYAQIVALFDEAIVEFTAERKANGEFTFDDLLLFTAEILRKNPTIRRRLQNRYKAIMVDEFQDTDPVQAEIVFLLAGEPEKDSDWQTVRPNPGSLFVVGDAKQSIYRFRRADIRIFKAVADRIEATGGKVVTLTTNFRSVRNLCETWNQGFKEIFDAIEAPVQASFAPLDAHRPPAGNNPFLTIKTPKVNRNAAETIAENEAKIIANYIHEQVQAGVYNYQDFLILTRADKRLKVFKNALVATNIPVDPVGGSKINDAPVLMALYDLVTCVFNAEKPIYWIKVLRGAFCGLSDDDLYQLKLANVGFDYRAELPEDVLKCSYGDHVKEIQVVMMAVAENVLNFPPAEVLQKLIDSLNIAPFFTHHHRDPEIPASIERLIALVSDWQSAGGHWGDILEQWDQFLSQKKERVGLITHSVGQSNGVRIMNVHQSKGLQASVVILADACGSPDQKPKMFISRSGTTSTFAMPIEINKSPIAFPLAWPDLLLEATQHNEAEKDRLLYVAATRAKNQLVLCDYTAVSSSKIWAKLETQFEEATEIKQGRVLQESPQPSNSKKSLIQIGLVERSALIESAGRPSYTETSVSKLKETEKPTQFLKGGHGKAYGTAIHHLIEEIVIAKANHLTQDNIQSAILTALEDEPEEKKVASLPTLMKAAAAGLQAFAESAVMQEVLASEEVFTEAPFSVMMDDASGNKTLLKGVIDLVYRTPAGWCIVDYKTDGVQSNDDLAVLWEMYGPQVMIYKKYWQELAGEPVVSAGLWSVPFAAVVGE